MVFARDASFLLFGSDLIRFGFDSNPCNLNLPPPIDFVVVLLLESNVSVSFRSVFINLNFPPWDASFQSSLVF